MVSTTVNADSGVAITNLVAAISSDLQGTTPPSTVPVRYEIGIRPVSSFSPIRSVSGFVKGVFGKNRGAIKAVIPSRDPRASLSMGDLGLPVTSYLNWKVLFVGRPNSCAPLVFSTPYRVDRKMIINPHAEAVVEGVGIWEGCLVGQFFDKRLPLHVVRSMADRL